MGYTISIGELKTEDGFASVETVKHNNAPADGVPTDYTNQRWPSYSAWASFEQMTGVKVVYEHPGYVEIKPELVSRINFAKKGYPKLQNVSVSAEERQNNIDRLNWLAYWVNWAVENCKNPVIVNS